MALVPYDGQRVCWWIALELDRARAGGWTGRVVSGYRTAREQLVAATHYAAEEGVPVTALYPHGVQASNHRARRWPGGAVDVTQPQQLAAALRKARRPPRSHRLVWAIDAGLDDWPHFSRTGH